MNNSSEDRGLKIPLKAVLFDFDGVVIDSLPSHLSAWKIASESLFGSAPKDLNALVGLSTVVIAGKIAKELGNPNLTTELMAQKNRALLEIEADIPLLPGAKELFEWLPSQSIKFGIGSNAPRAFIERMIKVHNLKVEVVVGRDDVPRPKPQPDMYLKCAQLLKIDLHDQRKTLVFEDSTHGLKAAHRAKMIPVGITTQHSDETLIKANAQFTAEHLLSATEKGVKDATGTLYQLDFTN